MPKNKSTKWPKMDMLKSKNSIMISFFKTFITTEFKTVQLKDPISSMNVKLIYTLNVFKIVVFYLANVVQAKNVSLQLIVCSVVSTLYL